MFIPGMDVVPRLSAYLQLSTVGEVDEGLIGGIHYIVYKITLDDKGFMSVLNICQCGLR